MAWFLALCCNITLIVANPVLAQAEKPSFILSAETAALVPQVPAKITATAQDFEGPLDLREGTTDDAVNINIKSVAADDRQKLYVWLISTTLKKPFQGERYIPFNLYRGKTLVKSSSLKVSAKVETNTDNLAKAELRVDGAIVLDGHASEAILTVTNLTDDPMTIGMPRPLAPKSFTIQPTEEFAGPLAATGIELKPRSTTGLRLTITASQIDPPAPGTHGIGVIVPLTRQGIGTADVTASQDVSYSVPGFSDISKALGVPSILLLPGFIAIVAFFTMMNVDDGKEKSLPDRLAFALNPAVWMIAITLSAGIVLAYQFCINQGRAVPRNILYSYALLDVIQLWGISLILGVVVGWIENAGGLHAFVSGKTRGVAKGAGDGLLGSLGGAAAGLAAALTLLFIGGSPVLIALGALGAGSFGAAIGTLLSKDRKNSVVQKRAGRCAVGIAIIASLSSFLAHWPLGWIAFASLIAGFCGVSVGALLTTRIAEKREAMMGPEDVFASGFAGGIIGGLVGATTFLWGRLDPILAPWIGCLAGGIVGGAAGAFGVVRQQEIALERAAAKAAAPAEAKRVEGQMEA